MILNPSQPQQEDKKFMRYELSVKTKKKKKIQYLVKVKQIRQK